MEKTLNTRIVLRNDSTVNWNAKLDQVLLRGEVGIEFKDNDRVKIKIGNGSTAWKDLPYFGGEEIQVFEVEVLPGDDHIVKIGEKVVKPAVGDIAIAIETISGDKKSRTAYVYEGLRWVAMDGNYNAENVYFAKDLVTTNEIGQIKLENGQATIPAAGKNLAELWETIFVKEKNGTVTKPTASLSAANTYIEVGSSANVTATVSYEDGKYEFGHIGSKVAEDGSHVDIIVNEATGATAETYNIQYDGKKVNSGNESSISVNSGTETTKASKAISASVSYTDGFLPVSNLGNIVAGNQIKAGTADAGSKTCFYWYVPMFHGFKLPEGVIANPKAITAEEVAALTKITGSQAYKGTVPTKETVSSAWNQYFIAVPTSLSKAKPEVVDKNGLPLTVEAANNVTIALGTASIEYNVYFVSLAAPYKTLEINVNW